MRTVNYRRNKCKCGNWKTEYSRQCSSCRLKEWNKLLGEKKKTQYIGKGNNRFGIILSDETRRKIKMSNKKVKIVEHHKYLKENSDIKIKMSPSNHSLLHQNVYKYLYIKYGKQGVDSYLKWFNKNIRRIF
jgi:predicted ATP-dependent serine protease